MSCRSKLPVAYVSCGIGVLSNNSEAVLTANGVPLYLLAKGRDVAAAKSLWAMGALDFSMAEAARIDCGRAVYGR